MALGNGEIDLSKIVQGEDVLASKTDTAVDKLEKLVENLEIIDDKSKKKIKISIDTSGVDPSKIDEVNTSIDTLNNKIKNPKGKMKYFQSIENAENEVIKSWNNFVKEIKVGNISTDDMFSNTSATAVLRFGNAFEALGGNLKDINPEIYDFISNMRQLGNFTEAKGYNYTVNGFKEAFAEFSKLKNAGIAFDGFRKLLDQKESILSLSDIGFTFETGGSGTGNSSGTGNGSGTGASSEEIKQLISLLESLNAEIIKIREAFGTIDDESGITSLLSQIQEINTYISTTSSEVRNLASKLSEIDFNLSINTGGGNKMAMTAEATREALKKTREAYEHLFDNLIGNYNSTDIFRGNGDLFNKFQEYGNMIDPDNMSKSLYAYKEMTSILKELASLKGIDISDWMGSYENDAIQANKALSDVISGSKEASEAAEKLSNIFGKGNTFNIDGEGLSSQLEKIIEQLKEIQDLMSKGLSFNDAVKGISNTEISGEGDNLLSIEEVINKITQAIQLKNEAFQLERQIVENAANSEVGSLRQVSDILDSITLSVKQCSEVFNKLGSSPINLNIFSDDDLERLKNLSSDLRGLSSLNDFFEKINSINIPDDLSSKINSLADAIENLKNKFEGFPESGINVFSQLNSLASQKDTLKDLAEVLNASSKKIDEAKDKISKKSKYDTAREYLSKNQDDIRNQASLYFEDENQELLSTELTATKNGLVEIKALTRSIGDDGAASYHNYVLTISEDSDLLVKSVSEGTVAAEKAGRAFERVFNTIPTSPDLEGFDILKDTDDWNELISVLDKFGIKANEVSKIVRSVRRDSDGNFLESFNVTTKDGSTRTIGRTSQSIISGKDEIANISDIENKYDALFKRLRTAKIKLASNSEDEFAIVDVQKAENEIAELEKLLSNLKGKMLTDEEYDRIIGKSSKYRNTINNDISSINQKNSKKENKKPVTTPSTKTVDINKQRENEVDDYIKNLERLRKAEQSFAKNGGEQNKAIIENLISSLSASKSKISGYLDQLSDEYKNKFTKIGEGIISDIAKINPNNQLVSDSQKDNAKVLSENEEVAASYDKLASKAERYYTLKNKQSAGKITERESIELTELENQVRLANEAMAGSSDSTNAYVANLNGVKSGLDKVTESQQKYVDAMNDAQEKMRTNYASVKNDDLLNTIKSLENENDRPDAYFNKLKEIQDKFEEIKELTAKGVVSDDAFGDYTGKIKEIESLISEIRKGGEYSYAGDAAKSLDAKITKWSNTNSAAYKKYKSEIDALTDKLQEAGLTSAELDKVREAFNGIANSAEKAGISGQSFGDRIKSKFKELGSYLLSFASFYDIINIGKQAISIVTELDDALTEMRKVSDEPLSVLKSYQKETFDTASDIGTTSAQLQQSTADFMRLGESLNDAKESAADATILMNVSEFESIDDATDSLIAMSQAYDELGKMDIIDKLNNVGKLLAQTYSNIWRFYLR